MKILFVIDALGTGGAQRLFVNTVNGISKHHDVEVFLYNPNSEFYRKALFGNVLVRQANRDGKKGFSLNVLRDLVGHTKSSDIVVSFQPTANIYCALASIFSRRTKHISCEMSVLNETESAFLRIITNIANRMSDHVICNSFTQAGYIASLPGMKGKASTIWNGCEELNFEVRNPNDPQSHSMVVVGRVAYPKNGLRLVHALQIFYERNGFIPNVSWAGRDDSEDRSRLMKSQMLNFLESHPHLEKKFHWHGEVSDIGAIYAKSDTLLSISTYEGVPVVICEAMLSGCSVIASRISDNEIILGNGERGFLCDPLSPADICSAIEQRLVATAQDIQQMVHRARTYAVDKFSIEKMVSGYNQVIASLV